MESMIKDASILITGANGGIGIETTKILLERGAKRVALACRTIEKANQTKKSLGAVPQLEAYGGFDMQNGQHIAAAVDALPENEPYDILFFQAGGMIVSKDFQFIESEGNPVEKTIYQNVIGAHITLNELKKKNLVKENARIVFAGGEGARGIKGMIEKPAFGSVNELLEYIHHGKGKYSDINALGVSKFMAGLLVQELAEKDQSNDYIWFSPGLTAGTKGLANVNPVKRFVMEKIGFPMIKLFGLAQGPVQAARKYADCLDGKYGTSGSLIGAPEGKTIGKLVDQKPMNSGLTNHAFRTAFWEVSTSVL